ncbi:hypothetical protein [Spiroplasma sp. Moj]|uniref:hypothetical protein n=1 Tax=Spiroplasma sp. Moj TaxID=1922342 RepID=UPI0039F0EE0B
MKIKFTAIQQLVQLGISTVLTQGGITPIMKNLVTLQSLRNYGVQIQGGSGINLTNYREISHYCDAIHLGSAVHYDVTWNTALDVVKLQQLK